MPLQRLYLKRYAETLDEKQAQADLGLTNHRVAYWLRKDAKYLEAFTEAVSTIHETVKAQLEDVSSELPEAIRELMTALKPKDVTCPDCDYEFQVLVANQVVQARIVEMMMKATGHLTSKLKVEGEVLHTSLTIDQRMALSLHRKGAKVSTQAIRELVALGVIEDPDIVTVEGESHEV
jgi:hypothetical protein